MILKRPYAFLVKHFRIIHAILLLCSGFLVYKTWSVVEFFGTYIKNKQVVTGVYELASTYVTVSIFVVIGIIILLCGIIIYLLKYKKKPILFYVCIVIINIVLVVAYYFLYSFLNDFQVSTPDLRVVNVVRDVFRALSIIQIPIIAMCFVRTIGFDVKKFDFKRDLLDLGIEEADNEEYELDINLDKDVVKEKFNKRLRLFKYFYKENKFVFIGLEIVLGVVVVVSLVNFITSIETIYKEGQSFDVGNFKIEVVESYKTATDSSGERLNKQFSYVITKMKFTNKSNTNTTLSPSSLRLSYSSDASSGPIFDYNERLNDFGTNYFSQILKAFETREFIFIFEVPNEYIDNTLTLKYLDNLSYEEGELNYYYKKIKLSPKTFDSEIKKADTKYLGEEMNFSDTILGNTKLKINNIKLEDNFYYNIVKCANGECIKRINSINAKQNTQFDLTIMRLDLSLTFDKEKLGSTYYNSNFITQYGSIRFEINGKVYNNRIELMDVTPFTTNKYIFIQVRDKLKMADKIYLDFNIRDKSYTYIIKDKSKEEDNKVEEDA